MITKENIDKLKELQPKLTVINNKISGCFYVSASLKKKSKNKKDRIIYFPWNYENKKDSNFISERFYIDITLNEELYPSEVFETNSKLSSWEGKIPDEYWHVNSNGSLCLGEEPDILKMKTESNSFAQFIHQLITQYFYYMCYVKKYYGKEPWKAYRHGLFLALEMAATDCSEFNIKNIIKKNITFDINNWKKLLKKTNHGKIRNKENCPFCRVAPRKVLNCEKHRKQIQGYNILYALDRYTVPFVFPSVK